MKVLRCLIRKTLFYQVFANISQNLFESVLTPLLAISEEERILFEEAPIEFFSLAEDTCEAQTYESLKTEAAAMLEALADYIDGFVTIIVGLAVDSLAVHLGFKEAPVGKATLSKEEALLILSILSCQICTRNDLLFDIRSLFGQSNKVLPRLNDLELCRLYVFFSYNFIELFNDELDMGTPYLQSAF